MSRLDTAPALPLRRPGKICHECGGPITGKQSTARYCTDACRKTFNNRRQTRGAELYDMFMATRYERAKAEEFELQTMMARLASNFRAEDKETRGGRASWIDPKTVMERYTHLHAKMLY